MMRRVAVGLLLALTTMACSARNSSAPVTTVVVPAPASSAPATPAPASSVPASSVRGGAGSSSAQQSSAPPSSPPGTAPSRTGASTGRSGTTRATAGLPTTAASTPTTATDCAGRTLASLSEKQRIGQLLMIGIPADDLSSARALLGGSAVGGVFLAGRSTAGEAEVAAGIASIQQFASRPAGVGLHIAVDQEGGYVQTLQGDFPAIPTAVDQGMQSSAQLGAATAVWASSLVKAGVTLDLAPVADVVPAGTAGQNPPIGQQDRQYGSTPESVSAAVVTVVDAMLAAKLGTTVKHFPGLGRVTANTDTSTAEDPDTTATDGALQPFEAAIRAGTTAVMISSARYPQLDADNVAAFSRPIITGLLRNTLQFRGLVISDDLGLAVAVSGVPVGQRAVDFVRAGGDLVLTVDATDLPEMTAALTLEADGSPSFRARIDDAALHVLASKQQIGLLRCH